MNTSLLKFKPTSKLNETRDLNIGNGNDAETYSASLLLMAVGAEISWGSRNEDSRKIDLICSYDHPWYDKERLIFLIQVKSGASFGEKLKNGFKLSSSAKKLAQRTTHPICLVWVDRKTNSPFWAYVHPNTDSKSQVYGNNHRVTPPMRFDIARCQAQHLKVKKGGMGIIFTEVGTTISAKRQKAEMKYKRYQKTGIVCPCLGKIEFTRIGWRHMFRKTRSATYKDKSLTTINYLENILADLPNEIYVSKSAFKTVSDFEYRNSEYVLTYEDMQYFDKSTSTKSKIKVVVRVAEEVRWPTNWTSNSTLSQQVDRRVVILSCYYK